MSDRKKRLRVKIFKTSIMDYCNLGKVASCDFARIAIIKLRGVGPSPSGGLKPSEKSFE